MSLNYDKLTISFRLFSNSLSFIGCLFIIFSFIRFHKLRRFAFRLVFYMTLNDFLFSLSTFFVFHDATPGPLCTLQAFLLYYSSVGTVLWTSLISKAIKVAVIDNEVNLKKLEKPFIITSIIVPFLLSIVPLVLNKYGPSSFISDENSNWCGIVKDTVNKGAQQLMLDMIVRFIPIIICSIYNGIQTYKIIRMVHIRLSINNDNLNFMSKLKLFPVIPLVVWLFEYLLRTFQIYSVITDSEIYERISSQRIICILDSIFEKSQGLLNAIFFGLNKEVFQEWRILITPNPSPKESLMPPHYEKVTVKDESESSVNVILE